MRFCKVCGKVTLKITSSGSIVFRCPSCSQEEEGNDQDALFDSEVLEASETAESWKNFLKAAAHDRTIQLVKRETPEEPPCQECGLDYMKQIRIGQNELVFHVCSCGNAISGMNGPSLWKKEEQKTPEKSGEQKKSE